MRFNNLGHIGLQGLESRQGTEWGKVINQVCYSTNIPVNWNPLSPTTFESASFFEKSVQDGFRIGQFLKLGDRWKFQWLLSMRVPGYSAQCRFVKE